MPDIFPSSEKDLWIGIIIFAFFTILILISLPKRTVWKEHCPHCNEEIRGGPKPGAVVTCPYCYRSIIRTEPHSSG